MPKVAVRIPQIGEGLQEARLVAVLKNPGDAVKRDEPIYQMETDKAVMDVESPYEGILSEWLAEVDTILAIGAEVARMEVAEGVEEIAPAHGSPVVAAETHTQSAASSVPAQERRTDIPPRTRAYAKEKGVSESDLAKISALGSKLMPEDIDAFLASGPVAKQGDGYSENPLSQAQRLLSSRLARGAQLVVPGTISVACNWEPIERARSRVKQSGDEFQPSAFTMFAYAVTQALKEFPAFRSILVGDSALRTYDHAHLGIAVALPGDQLVLAVVPDADKLSWKEFANATRAQIELARGGKDQATEAVTVSLTNMQSFGLRDAVPVVVSPSVATLFLGEVYVGLAQGVEEIQKRRYANLALTFDHRLINGVGAAEFINKIRENAENISRLVG